MATKNTDSKLAFVTQCSTMATGLDALPDTTLTVNNVTAPKAEWTQKLVVYVTAETDLTVKGTDYHQAVQTVNTTRVVAKDAVGELSKYLKARLGPTNPLLKSQFGVKPEKEPVRKVAVKAAAAAKGVATKSKKKAAAEAAVAPPAATTPAAPAAPTNGGAKPNGT